MRVFVTGATGFVGSAVVEALVSAGHRVVGLVRSDGGAQALARLGAQAHLGTLEDADSLRAGATEADAVVHTAFNHDFSRFAANCALDRAAIAALGDALVGTDKLLLATSGVALLAPGQLADESALAPPVSESYPRGSEAAVQDLVARGVHAKTVRLPPSVHGEGDHGFVPMLIALARQKGVSAYVDDQVHWATVHRHDAAQVYRLALERGETPGPYHAVAESAVPMQAIAQAIAQGLGLPCVPLARTQAAEHFGWFAHFAGLDMRASSTRTQAALGWQPTQCRLLDDLAQGHYFAVPEQPA